MQAQTHFIQRDGSQLCDGRYAGAGGDFKGHVLPGALFAIWALHWLRGSLRKYYSDPDSYRSQSVYRILGSAWPLEGILKIVVSAIGGLMELTFKKRDGYTRLFCEPGTLRAGRISASIHNWQHFSIYPGFFLSGAMDLVYHFLKEPSLPSEGDKVALGLAFFNEGLLMVLHEKHDPLNQILHQTLAYTMLGTGISAWAEAMFPTSMVASLCRAASGLSQSAIFFVIAILVYGGLDDTPITAAWDQAFNTDKGPSHYASVAIAQALLAAAAVCIYAVVRSLATANSMVPIYFCRKRFWNSTDCSFKVVVESL